MKMIDGLLHVQLRVVVLFLMGPCWLLQTSDHHYYGAHAHPIFTNDRVEFASHKANPPSEITVGAYYYPWYYRHFQFTKEGYVRKLLEPRQEIRLGEYDDREVSVVEQHLEWSRQANIDVWVSSWWGPNSDTNDFLKELVFPTTTGGGSEKVSNWNDHKVAILYETTGRIKKSTNYDHTINVPGDFEYICNTMKYVNHDRYYKIDGRPVIVIYLTRLLDGREILDDVVPIIRAKCPNVYIIGDQVWGSPPGKTLEYLDGITNYDVYGNMGRPQYAGQSRVDAYYTKSAQWKAYAATHNTTFIPAVSPGFNDRGVRLDSNHTALSRRLDINKEEGTLFAAQLVQANTLIDPKAGHLLLVNSFNEWHEDTQIEPCDGITTAKPSILTQGVEYVGYGTLYLDILATYTRSLSQGPAPASTRAVTFTGPRIASNITLGAYYWSWFTEEHFEDGLRANLSPPQTSTFSLSSDPITDDLRISWQANIRLWITPWERQGHPTDIGASSLFDHAYLQQSGHKLALHYYVRSRVQNNYVPGVGSNIYNDVLYVCGRYFSKPSYHRTSSGKPVLFLALSRALTDDQLMNAVNDIRMAAASATCKKDLYLVGDEVWGGRPTQVPYIPFSKLDAVMNLDVYGNMGEPAGYAGTRALDDYFEKQRQWRLAAWHEGVSYIPTVIPGFNDLAIRTHNMAMSRVLEEGGEEGSFFAASLDKAQHLVDPDGLQDMILIHSLNHFYEDTQIYPVCGQDTDLPTELTQDITYVAYGSLYLDLMTDLFGSYKDPNRPAVQPYKCPNPSPAPSLAPSRNPSAYPTNNPTKSMQPSGAPVVIPSNTPSSNPSGRPSSGPSRTPSLAPSKSMNPSNSPSSFPSSRPTYGCLDDKSFRTAKGKTCTTIKVSDCAKEKDARTNKIARDMCPLKCGVCTPTSTVKPTPSAKCALAPAAVWRNSKGATCLDIKANFLKGKDVSKDCTKDGTGGVRGTEACSEVCLAECQKIIL